jgi:hypothetical protein
MKVHWAQQRAGRVAHRDAAHETVIAPPTIFSACGGPTDAAVRIQKMSKSSARVAATDRAEQNNGEEGRSTKKALMSFGTYVKKGEGARQTGAPDTTVIQGKKRVSAAKRVSGSPRAFQASASESLPISSTSLLLSARASALHIPAGQTSPPEGGRDTCRR